MPKNEPSLNTRLMHTGLAPFDPVTGTAPVALPSMRTSTVRFKDLETLDKAQIQKAEGDRVVTYGRMGMDTNAALETVFSELENGTHTYLAPSGLAAITAVFFALLRSGDHALVSDSVYGPVRYLDHALLKGLNIEITYFGAHDDISSLVKENTRMVYVETPGSLLFEMLDLPALAQKTKALGIPLVADNTWGIGNLYRPLDLGAQVSVVAGTKYIGGHSDLLLGAAITNDATLAKKINTAQYAMGYAVSADDAWLALRGSRTLALRLTQHAKNAMAVCEFLESRPEVTRLFHPAHPSDPGHALWQRDCNGSNGMLAVHLNLAPAQGRALVDKLTLFSIGYSWGGFESLVQYVDVATLDGHSYWNQFGVTDGCVLRLHIGLESPEDLIADLANAMAG